MKTYKDIYVFPLHKIDSTSWVYDANNNFVFQFESKYDSNGNNLKKWLDFEDKIIDCLNGHILMDYNGIFTFKDGEIYCQKTNNENIVHIITIRGWGNLTGIGAHNLTSDEASNIQDTFTLFIINELNKKPLKADLYSCPNCDTMSQGTRTLISQTEPEFIIGPDPHYTWTEIHKCSNCNTFYQLKNGS